MYACVYTSRVLELLLKRCESSKVSRSSSASTKVYNHFQARSALLLLPCASKGSLAAQLPRAVAASQMKNLPVPLASFAPQEIAKVRGFDRAHIANLCGGSLKWSISMRISGLRDESSVSRNPVFGALESCACSIASFERDVQKPRPSLCHRRRPLTDHPSSRFLSLCASRLFFRNCVPTLFRTFH